MLGLRLFCHAVEVGFDKLNEEQRDEVIRYEHAQLHRLQSMRDGVDTRFRARLHAAIQGLVRNPPRRGQR